MFICLITHQGRVVSKGQGPSKAKAAELAILAVPDQDGDFPVSDCRVRFLHLVV